MKLTRVTAGCLAVWLLFNMLALAVWWGGVNAEGGLLRGIQGLVLAGFIGMLLFDLATGMVFLSRSCFLRDKQEADTGRRPCQDGWLLILDLLAVVGLAGAKVMVDEIGRETPLGWVSGGEWAILYICLTLQLAYLLAVVFFPSSPGHRP